LSIYPRQKCLLANQNQIPLAHWSSHNFALNDDLFIIPVLITRKEIKAAQPAMQCYIHSNLAETVKTVPKCETEKCCS